MKPKPPLARCHEILDEMGQIPTIVPGKLSERHGAGGKRTGWKLQRWHAGRNETRHIPAELVERVQAGTVGHRRFLALADEYAELRGREVLGATAPTAALKKKPTRP